MGRHAETVIVPVPTPTATPTAPPTATTTYYVVQVNLAAPASPTVVSGPATVTSDALQFAPAAAPLQMSGGQSYAFALAARTDMPVVPTPGPSDTPLPLPSDTPTPGPTGTPSPVPSDTPVPTPSPTISPCPGAIAISQQGTYCTWAIPNPPVDMSLSNPDIMYSSPNGVIGRFNVRDHTVRELAINGTPYSITPGEQSNQPGTYVAISSATNNLGFVSDASVAQLDLFAPPPSIPASPHNIAGYACNLGNPLCTDVAIANGDVYFYNPVTQTVDMDIALTNPPATASVVVKSYNSSPFDILALTPDRHIVYASMDDHGQNFTEHVLPDVMPAGYRFTGASREATGFHFTASDFQIGGNPRGHGFHTAIDLTTFASHNVGFDRSGATCDAMGISTGPTNGTYFIPCVIEVREFRQSDDQMVHDLPIEADGAVTYQSSPVDSFQNAWFSSYRLGSIIELQYGVFYPGVRQQSKLRAPTATRRH